MTKFKIYSITCLILAVFAFIFSFGLKINAQQVQSPQLVVEDYNFTSEKTEFKSGENLTFDQTMNGERIGFAQEVIVNGITEKNLVVAGGKVEINGDVNGSLFVAGGIVIINGNIKGNIYSASSEIYINSEVIDGDIFVASGKNFISKDIPTDKLHLSNPTTEPYTKGATTRVSDTKFSSVNFSNPMTQYESGIKAFSLIWKFIGILSSIIFVYLLLVIFKGPFSKISSILNTNDIGNLILKAVIGFCLVIGLWIASFILIFTGIGTIPAIFLMLFLLISWMYCHFISYYLVGSFVSKWLPSFADHRIVIAIVGVLVMVILSWIPIIASLAALIHSAIGFAIFAKFLTDRFQSSQAAV